jgi:hypothetical protein
MNKSALLSLTLAAALGVTGMEGMTPSGVDTYKSAMYLFKNDIISKVTVDELIEEYLVFYGKQLTTISAQQVLNQLNRSGIINKMFDTNLKQFIYYV